MNVALNLEQLLNTQNVALDLVTVIITLQQIANEWVELGAVTGILDKDSANIVKLIRDNYEVSSS